MLLALTWGHCTPADTPARVCTTAISTEQKVDDVACASYVSRQGVAAALLHQGCPVPVRDCQVVVAITVPYVNVKCSELQRKDQSLLHLDRLCPLKIVGVVVGVVW